MQKVIFSLPIVPNVRPEEMRVTERQERPNLNVYYTVEVFSNLLKDWLIVANWYSKSQAIEDCKNWYI